MIYLMISNLFLFISMLVLFLYNDIIHKDLKKTKEQIITKYDLTNFAEKLKIREDLIKSDFKGKVKNKKLLKEMFDSNANYNFGFFGYYYYDYNDIKQEIIDYNFNNIERFLDRLKKFEEKQETLDKYQIKKR